MYSVIFDEKAIEFLNKLEKSLKSRIYNKILETKQNPFRFFKKLKERKDYSLRIGNYRVIADIHQSSGKIHVTLIGHRKNIYD